MEELRYTTSGHHDWAKRMNFRGTKQASRWIFIILVSWGLVFGVYHFNIINNIYLHYTYYRQREVLWNDNRNAVSDFKPERNRSSTLPLKNTLTSGLKGSDVKADLLSPLHMHINLEAASIVR
ncbi:uncharacterized protein LOC117124690 isoform X1 [Anneissia japonica]|uniref:uncharacterized protein LOC117124690 isoform X1 n=1 Tax=Anneissia japonica TaxID=1529436 RepID=UPI00142558E0|nr:uncharacterized protein LOC117124690 isoform X1 [Anneissia japonica]